MIQPTEAEENAILALLERWRLATEAKDADVLLELCADDVVLLPSSGAPVRGKDAVARMYQLLFAHYHEVNQNVAVEELQVGGDWAFLWGTHDLRLTPHSGAPLHMRGHGFSVLKRQGGTWRFWRGINNMSQQTA